MRSRLLPMVFLKQFRDGVVPRAACHQSLLLCRARGEPLAAPRLLTGRFTLRLPPHPKPDVAGQLGLPHELETSLAVELSHDLHMPAAVRLWP